jgi:hypothetical protein
MADGAGDIATCDELDETALALLPARDGSEGCWHRSSHQRSHRWMDDHAFSPLACRDGISPLERAFFI